MKGVGCRYVDVSLQDVAQVEAKPGQIHEAAAALELNQKVNVAPLRGFSSSHRPEDTGTNYPTTTHRAVDLLPKLVDRWTHGSRNLRGPAQDANPASDAR